MPHCILCYALYFPFFFRILYFAKFQVLESVGALPNLTACWLGGGREEFRCDILETPTMFDGVVVPRSPLLASFSNAWGKKRNMFQGSFPTKSGGIKLGRNPHDHACLFFVRQSWSPPALYSAALHLPKALSQASGKTPWAFRSKTLKLPKPQKLTDTSPRFWAPRCARSPQELPQA